MATRISVSLPPNDREHSRTGLSADTLRRAFMDNLFYQQARFPEVATTYDHFMALSYTVRDRLLHRWIHSASTFKRQQCRTVAYLSAEFLLGPHLGNNLLNLGIQDNAREAMSSQGIDLDDLREIEEEPGLGNGGLGRLAACYMDSLATLQVPAIGYGIRYEFGIFDQIIRDGWQIENTDKWLHPGNPWEIRRPKIRFPVKFGGYTEHYTDDKGHRRIRWVAAEAVSGTAFDTPIAGFRVDNVNLLRLWRAEAAESFDFDAFNVGNYYGAVDEKVRSENLTKVLYPNDEPLAGKELRLKQQYFFVSCSLQDMVRIHGMAHGDDPRTFPEKWAIQLNDTHPAIAVPELMRLLVDEQQLDWDAAWDITRRTFAYTNHTLLPEALEKWSVDLIARILPRHLEIIYEINARFLDEVRMRFPTEPDRVPRMSIIEEGDERFVRMAHLACAGSHAVNGVAALHTELLKTEVMRDFHEMWPDKFRNVTNGVTPRRFLALINPGLSRLITETIGPGWEADLMRLKELVPHVDDAGFRQAWGAAKLQAKQELAGYIHERCDVEVDPNSMFDVQVKRIHEYKRQHLNALHIIHLYRRLKADPGQDMTPRTFVFGGKAAPSYYLAKLIIKLITSVGDIVNHDPDVRGRLRVAFVPDYNVKTAQHIYPAADLSEQISMAGKEASGTGNMKLSMNGALTIGTLDGANVEIREEVGEENFFLFGLTAPEVRALQADGYKPREVYEENGHLRGAIDLLGSGLFSHGDTGLFQPIIDNLLNADPYLVLADFQAYVECQERVENAFRDPDAWTRMSILNAANMGRFSSDRSIKDYCNDIWRVQPVPIELTD